MSNYHILYFPIWGASFALIKIVIKQLPKCQSVTSFKEEIISQWKLKGESVLVVSYFVWTNKLVCQLIGVVFA